MKPTLLICTILLCLGFFNRAAAQNEFGGIEDAASDSTTYNLGRTVLKKRDVQAVTIKAADLEKMPFRSLKDVISLYTNGIFAAKQSYVFVIDGVLNTDINAYSIYDIDELTFIQNAATVLNGGDATKILILVKTKRGGPDSHGITFAGQTNAVRLYKPTNPSTEAGVPDGKTTTELYHQYYVSAYANTGGISAGISGDIQHNITPIYLYNSPNRTRNAPVTNRLKFHGYLDAHLGEMNLISLNAGYVSQHDFGTQNSIYDHTFQSPSLYYGDLKITTKIADGFYNVATASLQQIKNHIPSRTPFNGLPNNYALSSAGDTLNNYVLQDNISYETSLNDITIRPNVNFIYRYYKAPSYFYNENHLAGGQVNTEIDYSTNYQKLVLLTPAITVGYTDFLSLTVGFQTYLNNSTYTVAKRRFLVNGSQAGIPYQPPVINTTAYEQTAPLPFATLSVNPLLLADIDSTDANLKVYASYAKNFNTNNDVLGSLNNISTANTSTLQPNFLPAADPYKVYTQLQGGATFAILENALTFSYNYSLRKFNTGEVVLIRLPTFQDYYMNTTGRVELHRAGVDFNLPTDGDLTWRTSLNGTLLIMRDAFKERDYLSDYMRLIYPGKPFITGGFTNQFGYQGLFLDFSILYAINQAAMKQVQYLHYNITGSTGTFDLQNIDLGYKFPTVPHVKSLEVYLNARNLFQNGQSATVETLRYFGGGLKVEL